MVTKAFVGFDAAFSSGPHQVDAAPGRFGLEVKHSICRTFVKTEAAVDALVELGDVQARDTGPVSNRFCLVALFQRRTFFRALESLPHPRPLPEGEGRGEGF